MWIQCKRIYYDAANDNFTLFMFLNQWGGGGSNQTIRLAVLHFIKAVRYMIHSQVAML